MLVCINYDLIIPCELWFSHALINKELLQAAAFARLLTPYTRDNTNPSQRRKGLSFIQFEHGFDPNWGRLQCTCRIPFPVLGRHIKKLQHVPTVSRIQDDRHISISTSTNTLCPKKGTSAWKRKSSAKPNWQILHKLMFFLLHVLASARSMT